MHKWFEQHKPRSSVRVQYLLAGALWSAVGFGLAAAGTLWIAGGREVGRSAPFVALGLFLGWAKSRYVLDGTARGIVERLRARGSGRCVGGFLSIRSWLLVFAMIALGKFLRATSLPLLVIGVLYLAIGAGLLRSSRLAWSAWRRSPQSRL